MNSLLGHGLIYDCEIVTPDGEVITFSDHNLLPQVSIDFIAGLIMGSGAPNANWYLGLYEGNYVPTSGVTAADLPGVVGECTAYSQATRPSWSATYDGVSLISNLSSKAVFSLNAPKTIYGAFIVSNSTKAGNTGLLLSIARFSTPRALEAGTEFGVAAGLTLTSAT
ncbi:hypothetical protein D3C81_914110 [compost metagenome]